MVNENERMTWIALEIYTGAMDGCYNDCFDESGKANAQMVAENLTERHPGSCWVVCGISRGDWPKHKGEQVSFPSDFMWHADFFDRKSWVDRMKAERELIASAGWMGERADQ